MDSQFRYSNDWITQKIQNKQVDQFSSASNYDLPSNSSDQIYIESNKQFRPVRFENKRTPFKIQKKNIIKPDLQRQRFENGRRQIMWLLSEIVKESTQQAENGKIFQSLLSCQHIKQMIDKLERMLINMKSILLSRIEKELNTQHGQKCQY